MKISEVERIIEGGESVEIEFKERVPRADDLAKTIGALANSGGGIVSA